MSSLRDLVYVFFSAFYNNVIPSGFGMCVSLLFFIIMSPILGLIV